MKVFLLQERITPPLEPRDLDAIVMNSQRNVILQAKSRHQSNVVMRVCLRPAFLFTSKVYDPSAFYLVRAIFSCSLIVAK